MNVQLVHHLLTMLLDGLDADAQFPGDLFVGKTFRDKLQDFRLPGGQLAVLFG